MSKWVRSVVVGVCLLGLAATVQSQEPAPKEEKTVYVTKSGKKYHTASCQHARNAREIKISDAKARGYTPCSVCKPG